MKENAPPKLKITPSDRLGFTLFIALMLHALVVLGISFNPTTQDKNQSIPSLEVILAQTKSATAPKQFDFLAQQNQQGGGESSKKARPGAAMSANTPIDLQGFADKNQEELKKSIAEKQQLNPVATQNKSLKKVSQNKQQQPATGHNSDSVTQYQLRVARLQAEIKKLRTEYAKRPKLLVLTASTKKADEASYLSEWVRHIERTGNLNYPQKALSQNISGSLRLQVTIDSNGNVLKMNISKSSNSTILDAAAKRIVKLSAPFKQFSNELKKKADQIVIIRTWEFSSQHRTFNTSS